MLDTLLRGGTIVDGTGGPARVGDVGVRDGRIVAVGDVDEPATRVVDASDRVVAPGFVDIHVHYDAQVFWDPALTPSVFHGVTTVVGGNCGFSIAPLAPSEADYLMRMLARVEGMPLETLEKGVPWDWTTYEEWRSRIDGTLAVNAGFLVGHSAIRRVVMGERSYEHATDDDLAEMLRLTHESLAAGALGFSTSVSAAHNDGDGRPVPSRNATRDELLALCAALRDHVGTVLELAPTGAARGFSDDDFLLMSDMSLAAQRPLNWNLLAVSAAHPESCELQLAISTRAEARGAQVVALTLPDTIRTRLTLLCGVGFDAMPQWDDTMALPPAARMEAFRNPEVRRRLREGAAQCPPIFTCCNFPGITIAETFVPENRAYSGRTVGEIARAQKRDPLDVLLDIALADDLRTGLVPAVDADDDASWKLRAEVWRDDRTVLGASDAGAHLDMMCNAGFTTALLGKGVREKGLLPIEEAVHQLTDVPARLYGLRGRGRIEPGLLADLVVFDPETVGLTAEYTRRDLPGDAERMYCDALGVDRVFVNGAEVVDHGEHTGAAPGTLLASGRDTDTVTPKASAAR